MSKQEKVPGTYVSDSEAKQLALLLQTFREYIVSHEARLEAMEEWANEVWKMLNPQPEAETDGTEEAEGEEVPLYDPRDEFTPVGDESPDDSSEG